MIPILVIFWGVFFSPWIFHNLHPIPSDIISGMYYPWIEQSLGPIAGIPVKNPLLTDTVSQFWIWRNWAISNIQNNISPFWNPYSLLGQESSPWFHTILFSPLNIFYLIFNQINAMSAIVAAQLLLSLIFFYIYLHRLTRHQLASLFGSLAFSFSSYFIGWLTWGTVSATLSFLPLCLLALHDIRLSNKPMSQLILFLANIFAIFSGHPQTYFYFLLITLSYIFFHHLTSRTIPTIVFSIVCASIVLLPSAKIIINSIRSQDTFVQNNNNGFIHPFEMIANLATPGFFGTPATNNYWGIKSNFQEKLVWFGIIPLLFSINWILQKRKIYSDTDKWLIFLFITGILLSTQYPLGMLIYTFKIPLLSTSPAGRGFIITIFAACVMAAIHLSSKQKLQFTFISTILISLYLFLAISYPSHTITKSNFIIAFRNLTFSTVIITAIYLASIYFKKIFIYIVIIISFIDLLYFAIKYTPFTPSKYYFPKNNLLSQITSQNDFYRIERVKEEIVPPNMWQPYGLSTSQGYDPTLSTNYIHYLQSQGLVKKPTRYIEWNASEISQLPDFGIKYALTLKRDLDNKLSITGLPPQELISSGWKVYSESGTVSILENPKFKPPYYLSQPGNLKLLAKTDDSWTFDIDTSTPNQIIVIENHIPYNWQASINNQYLPIDYFHSTFKQIKLPSGSYTLKLKYSNQQFYWGAYISVLGLLSFIIYLRYLYYHESQN